MATVGLYSYPRSGSNWIRLIVYSLLIDNQDFINEDLERGIPGHPDGEPLSGPFFETVHGPFQLFKTHALNIVSHHNGVPMDTRHYFYVYRHPLDVFCSYMNFLHVYGQELQWAFELPLVSFDEHVRRGTIDDFFSLFIVSGTVSAGIEGAGSWWKSMRYWQLMKSQYPNHIHLLRYEDIVKDPVEYLLPVARFFNKTPKQLSDAIDNVSRLYSKDGAFFWKMQSGYYRELLPPHLIEKFQHRFGEDLKTFGYAV